MRISDWNKKTLLIFLPEAKRYFKAHRPLVKRSAPQVYPVECEVHSSGVKRLFNEVIIIKKGSHAYR